ncbi:unnamed protein product [Medioppia subpectinata]|uniref:Uncharacterized protein n=1 Tax=Medioppia subpectinata TaxID=1979941 RepID=A0A7R9QLK5_9ACAR|nr:unnamed protein product [Medioppia subpectinata]CAG2122890.1 unnamed protein product [Medioppia subpectinata]
MASVVTRANHIGLNWNPTINYYTMREKRSATSASTSGHSLRLDGAKRADGLESNPDVHIL